MANLGRLEPVSLRGVWLNEAADFTPWLAENLDTLGQAVGLALELRRREHPVGRYALDLLLEDAQGRVVIVENQLEQTDHTHLGQLLTYCAGAGADVVIWIAQSITEEHAAALEWLNDNTVAGVGFFGIELELLKIGDSLPAPNFKLVVRPNDWAKSTRTGRSHPASWTWETYATELNLPEERIVVGQRLVEAIIGAAEERGLPWQPVMNKGYIAIQRPGGYNVLVVDLYYNRVPRLAAKIPEPPQTLGLTSPYPGLHEVWVATEHEWGLDRATERAAARRWRTDRHRSPLPPATRSNDRAGETGPPVTAPKRRRRTRGGHPRTGRQLFRGAVSRSGDSCTRS